MARSRSEAIRAAKLWDAQNPERAKARKRAWWHRHKHQAWLREQRAAWRAMKRATRAPVEGTPAKA